MNEYTSFKNKIKKFKLWKKQVPFKDRIKNNKVYVLPYKNTKYSSLDLWIFNRITDQLLCDIQYNRKNWFKV